jgi:predicted alpha/beta-fold hydrolase
MPGHRCFPGVSTPGWRSAPRQARSPSLRISPGAGAGQGLGGARDAGGQRRLARALAAEEFAVIRLNLRGAGPGRHLARGSYAAACTADLLPVLRECRRLAAEWASPGHALPLGAAGISLGGTVLLNALLDSGADCPPAVDALVTISSPLELAGCSDQFNRPRNRLYQHWMVRRLIQQTLLDPHPLSAGEREGLTGPGRPRTIREFDALITAPRWGFADVDAYYQACSPMTRLRQLLHSTPPTGAWRSPRLLLLHAKDDPWVPAEAIVTLKEEAWAGRSDNSEANSRPCAEVVITAHGGHCGFHAPEDTSGGRWSDRLAARWLRRTLVGRP